MYAHQVSQGPRPVEAVVQAQGVEQGDSQDPLQEGETVQSFQVVGPDDGDLPPFPKASQPTGLGHIFGVIRIVHQAVVVLPQRVSPATLSIGLEGNAGATEHSQPSPRTARSFLLEKVVNGGEWWSRWW